jgi:hypothetical protein
MDDFPEVLSRDQVRFEVLLAVQRVQQSTLRDWAGKDRAKREQARATVVQAVLARLDLYQMRARSPLSPPGDRTLRPVDQ